MNPSLLAKIARGLAGASQGMQDPMGGLGQLAGGLWRKRHPSQGAELPNNPLMQPTDIGRFGPGAGSSDGSLPMPMQPMDPGFQPSRPRFPGDPGIDPGMTPPDQPELFGPVPLGGTRRRRFGQRGRY